jgi:glutathione S-transferase
MKLLYQTHSPYARKVLVAALETGLGQELEVVHHETSPMRRNQEVFALNPLGKVPVLITDDGTVLFDSNVICEYLDGLFESPKLIPPEGRAHYQTLRWQALAQGIADAGIAARWETERRPESLRWPRMRDGQLEKIAAACDFLEQEIHTITAPDVGAISLATALSWIDFRGVYPFQAGRPQLSSWYAEFSARASMLATALSGATQD